MGIAVTPWLGWAFSLVLLWETPPKACLRPWQRPRAALLASTCVHFKMKRHQWWADPDPEAAFSSSDTGLGGGNHLLPCNCTDKSGESNRNSTGCYFGWRDVGLPFATSQKATLCSLAPSLISCMQLLWVAGHSRHPCHRQACIYSVSTAALLLLHKPACPRWHWQPLISCGWSEERGMPGQLWSCEAAWKPPQMYFCQGLKLHPFPISAKALSNPKREIYP